MICPICQRRQALQPQACEPCRAWLPGVLTDIGKLHAQVEPARRAGGGPKVSGSRDAPLPVHLDAIDLTAPARQGSLLPHANAQLHQHAAIVHRTRTLERHDYAALWKDQIGHLSVATELETWVIDWIGQRELGEHRPEPTVAILLNWLTVRLDWACDHHLAIDEYAEAMRQLRASLRTAAGDQPTRPEPIIGIPCSHCDLAALIRDPGSQWHAECGNCGKLYSDDEYRRWTGLQAGWARHAPHP